MKTFSSVKIWQAGWVKAAWGWSCSVVGIPLGNTAHCFAAFQSGDDYQVPAGDAASPAIRRDGGEGQAGAGRDQHPHEVGATHPGLLIFLTRRAAPCGERINFMNKDLPRFREVLL